MVPPVLPIPSIARRRGSVVALALALLSGTVLRLAMLVAKPHALLPGTIGPAATPAPPVAGPALILHLQITQISAVLGNGLALRGTMQPSLPGPNTLHLAVDLPSTAAARTGQLTLVATMSGMAMPPSRLVLSLRDRAGAGTIQLPMFGDYLVLLTLRTPTLRTTGTMTLALPLPYP